MNPTPEQQRVIDATGRKIVIIAGPGSGKTATLVLRILADIERGANPHMMVCITFTNAGARELKKRLSEHGVKLKFVGTLHAFCLSLLPGMLVIGAETAVQLGKATLENCGMNKTPFSTFENAKALSPDEMDAQNINAAVRIAVKAYRKTLVSMGATDYDLLLVDGLAFIRSQFERITTHVYVDEYQDSAPIDAQIYEALAPLQLFIVGDSDQSIFGFRGATMANLMTAASSEGAILLRLEKNFRCSAAVCRAANALIKNNANRIPKETVAASDNEGSASALICTGEQSERSAIMGRIIEARNYGLPLSDIAILCRYNSTRQSMVEMLKGEGLPVADAKEPVPAERARLLAALQLKHSPDSPVLAAHWHCMNNPTANFGTISAAMMRKAASGERIAPAAFFEHAVNSPESLAAFLAKCEITGETARDAVRTMRALELDSVAGMLCALMDGYNTPEGGGDAITVTTYHGAKGREWRVVIAPRCDQATSPGNKAGDALEEERRLFFVMLTRAKDAVLCTVANSRKNDYTPRIDAQLPSQFILEAGLLA